MKASLEDHPQVRHVRVADGRGKKLGRSFAVKLWPTLIFLRDGQVIETLVRPDPEAVYRAVEGLAGG